MSASCEDRSHIEPQSLLFPDRLCPLGERATILRPNKRTIAIVVAIMLVASSAATYFFAIYLPSIATIPCVTTGNTHCFTIVASLSGYNGSVHQPLPYPVISVPKGDTVVLRLINNDSAQSHGLAVQVYAANGIIAHVGETKTMSFQATTIGKFQIYDPIITTIDAYEKAELDVS